MSHPGSKALLRLSALGLLLVLCFGLGYPHVLASPEEGSAQEKALRARVEEFYGLLQVGQWSQAESYLTEDSKEKFRHQEKKPFVGFQIESIKLEPDGQKATVVVPVQVFTAFSATPLSLRQTTDWRLVNNVWYMVIPEPSGGSMKELFSSPKSTTSRPPEQLKFKGHRYNLATVQPGQTKVARFPFTNVTDHVVTVKDVATGCECLHVKLEKKEYKPGESGELAVDFDSTGYMFYYSQTIVVKTDPGGLKTYLTIEAFVERPKPKRPEPAGEKKPDTERKS